MIVARFAFFSSASLGLALSLGLTACGGAVADATGGSSGSAATMSSNSSSGSTGSEGTGGGGTTTGSGGTSTTTGAGGGAASTVTFTFTPQWEGVTAVTVIGAFGTSTDWKMPFATLAAGAGGKWTGTAQLPAGQYAYLFQVTGNSDGAMAPKLYIDPGLSAFVQCPAGSPTAGADPNPCSQLTVPQSAPDAMVHITGKVTYAGQGIKGYPALVERDEMGSHHFPANLTNTMTDGSFDLSVAAGTYRIQVLHPTFYNMTDEMRDPLTLKAQRRALSAAFPVAAAAVALDAVEMQYLGYAALSPTGTVASLPTATAPTTFTITVIAGSKGARAAVYGTKGGTGANIGDPWFASSFGAATSVAFNGAFPTMQALEPMVMSGESYFWGTWQELDSTAPATWTGESMVFPIKWN